MLTVVQFPNNHNVPDLPMQLFDVVAYNLIINFYLYLISIDTHPSIWELNKK